MKQIENYVKSGKPGIYLVSSEEARAEAMLRGVAEATGFALHIWSVTQGLINVAEKTKVGGEDPLGMLDDFLKLPEKSLVIARDFHQFLDGGNPLLTRKVKDALAVAKTSNRVLVILGCRYTLPPELEREITLVEFKLPTREELLPILTAIAESAAIPLNGNTEVILDAAAGCTSQEAEDAFALSVIESKDILPEIIAREKSRAVKKNGLLEIIETTATAEDIGGLDILKDWLRKRRFAFSKEAKAYGLPVPKGILVTGIAGVGKSLTAKAAASILGLPLIRLDAGRVFGSLVGESERNIRSVIQTAEAIAPCVVWCDEIEKAFSGSKSSGSSDGGTSARVLGTFLSWMQDKTAPVFVFATANDISQLPPEFLRKGRFEDLFFCDLPDTAERADIWRLHLNKRGRDADKFNLQMLAERSEGFTGAEIEAAINEGLFAGFDDGQRPVTDDDLLEAIRSSVPLSRTMASQIDSLRAWANGRARRASSAKDISMRHRKLA